MFEIDGVTFLAQAAPPTSAQPTAPQGTPRGGGPDILLLFLPLFILMILITIFSGRKQKKQRERMLTSLNKHDRVQTLGGVIGTIVELGDSEVVLKVDDTSNTRIRFARSAVQQVLRSRTGAGTGEPAEVKPNLESAPR